MGHGSSNRCGRAGGVGNEARLADSLPLNRIRSSFSVLYAISDQLPSSAICSFLRMRDERRTTLHERRAKRPAFLSMLLVVGAGGKSQGGVFLARLAKIDYIGHIQEHKEVYS